MTGNYTIKFILEETMYFVTWNLCMYLKNQSKLSQTLHQESGPSTVSGWVSNPKQN